MKRAWIIAKNSLQEALRKKTLYILVVVALVVIGASRLFSFLSAEEEMKMIRDVSFSTIEFFGALIAIFGALGAISTELEKRTIYTLLSKPIGRREFILGKFIGQSMILLINYVLMCAFFIGLLLIKKSPPDIETLKTLILIYMELLMISSITLMVATFASDAFNLVFSFFLYIVGHLMSYGRQMMERTANVIVKGLSDMLYTLVPNYENFNIKDKVVVGVKVSWLYVVQTVGYGFIYLAIALFLAVYFFQKREV